MYIQDQSVCRAVVDSKERCVSVTGIHYLIIVNYLACKVFRGS